MKKNIIVISVLSLSMLGLIRSASASNQSVTVNFELQSPIAYSSIVAADLGILDISIINNNYFLVYDTLGTTSSDSNSVFIGGSVIMPSVGITGDAGTVMDITVSETPGDVSGLDFSNFKCDHDGNGGAAAASCSNVDGYTIIGTGSEQTLDIGFTVSGDNNENPSPTVGAKTASITVSSVYQ